MFSPSRRREDYRRRTTSRIPKVAGKRHFFRPRLAKSPAQSGYAATDSAFPRAAATACRSVSASHERNLRPSLRPLRHDHRGQPELRALLRPSLGLCCRSQPARQAYLAERGGAGLSAAHPAPQRRSRARRSGRLRARRCARPPATFTKTSAWPSAIPAWRERTATIIASRFGSTPVATRRGIARSVCETSAWISSRSGRVPSSAQATAAPTSPSLWPKTAEGSGHALQAGARHLEDAELVRRAEAVLRRPQHPVRVVAIALELEHAVDEVLEHARAGDRAVLRHVADEEESNARLLRQRAANEPRPRGPERPSPALSRCRPSRASAPSRSRRHPAARARASRTDLSRFVSARISTCSAPPRRAARSFTCAVDSSPVTSSARRSREIAASAISRSVDFPTPGSPPTRTSEAGTSPPPSTRSSSGTPVGIRAASSTSTSARRSSGFASAWPFPAGGACSTSVPKLAQLGQRPSQRPVEYPQSEQEKCSGGRLSPCRRVYERGPTPTVPEL